MYQYDQLNVSRHIVKLQLFHIRRKPSCPDIHSDG